MKALKVYTSKDIVIMKTFTIELRVSYDTEEQDTIIKNSARQAAKHLYATAILLADKRKPQIALYTSDFIEGAAEIELADDMPEDVSEEFTEEFIKDGAESVLADRHNDRSDNPGRVEATEIEVTEDEA